eukprot:5052653-Pyramimonas_sp.AAC.1
MRGDPWWSRGSGPVPGLPRDSTRSALPWWCQAGLGGVRRWSRGTRPACESWGDQGPKAC